MPLGSNSNMPLGSNTNMLLGSMPHKCIFLAIATHSCTNGTLRLVDGSLESAGTVEVCINGVWGRVCDFLLGDRFARVVCRQLGYSVNTGQGELVHSLVMYSYMYV